jgi:hypothetical protein
MYSMRRPIVIAVVLLILAGTAFVYRYGDRLSSRLSPSQRSRDPDTPQLRAGHSLRRWRTVARAECERTTARRRRDRGVVPGARWRPHVDDRRRDDANQHRPLEWDRAGVRNPTELPTSYSAPTPRYVLNFSSSKRASASGSRVINETRIATAKAAGIEMIAGLRSGTMAAR